MTFPGRHIGLGHSMAAVCFAALAALRFVDGAWVWGSVFLIAAALQIVAGLCTSRSRGRSAPERDGTGRRWSPATADMSSWRLLTVSSAMLTAALLFVNPPLSVIAALVTAYCARTLIVRVRAS